MFQRFRKLFRQNAPPLPLAARHIEYSAIISADDDILASDDLIKLALKAVDRSRSISMKPVSARMTQPPFYPEIWPGEHYKLLAGLAAELAPKTVIEIGTSTGLSALALLQTLPAGSSLHTFDIIPWNQFPDTALRNEDFMDGRLRQIIGDVGHLEVMRQHRELFSRAEFIFVDGPKDGAFEQQFLDNLAQLNLTHHPLLLFDDIRVWKMLAIWRQVKKPKLDLTSFGHWSGTGLVLWD
jgi:predicted O-methyltransferase YrrM